MYKYQPLSFARAVWSPSLSLSRASLQHRKRGTCARRYLSDFSKRETNLNCRSQAIPTVVHFPWNALAFCLLSSTLFLSRASFVSFSPAVASSTSWFFVLTHRGSHRERPLRSSFFGERNAADEQRFAEGTRDLRGFRTWRDRRGAEMERILAVRAVKRKSKRQIPRSILVERETNPVADKITDESDTSGRKAVQSAFCFYAFFSASPRRSNEINA